MSTGDERAEALKADSLKEKTSAFLNEFFEKGEAMIRELIIENEKLRKQLEAPLPSEIDESDPGVIRSLVARISGLEREIEDIRRIAGAVEQESGDYRSRLDELEREHYELACRHVAAVQFQTAETFEEVLRTSTEILLNFVGIGAFAIYLIDEQDQSVFPIMREGGDRAELPSVDLEGLKSRLAVLGLGRAWTDGDPLDPFEAGELMTLPLYAGSRLLGLARLQSFLTQKPKLDSGDSALLSLVSEHAGIGIETAWVRAHAEDAPLVRGAVEELVGA